MPKHTTVHAEQSMVRLERALTRFQRVRGDTERLAAPLSDEDQLLQSMPACSPVKWHRAHTTWFFETFLLAPRGIAPVEPRWSELFNSYYVGAGARGVRADRGLLSRPSCLEIESYRRTVDERVAAVVAQASFADREALLPILELGIAHEEQHQELLLTDLLNAFAQSPLRPVYRQAPGAHAPTAATPLELVAFNGGLREIGAPADDTFRFDNEEPRHRVFVEPFALASRLVSVGEWKAFADERGYETPSLWLSDGFDWAAANAVRAPLYCARDGSALVSFGLDGTRELSDEEPVTHLSFYEAEAIARFMGARLPTEAEWELAAAAQGDATSGNFVETGLLRAAAPRAPSTSGTVLQLFGDAWEWTCSAYAPYPGFTPHAGTIGEYNGKFMVNQLALRGGSCFTPRAHVRPSYRNFWHADTRFQVTGLRLARGVKA